MPVETLIRLPCPMEDPVTVVPQKVVCSKCGYVLHEEEEDLKPPDEIIQMFEDERCPRCGHKLSVIPVDVKIYPIRRVRRRAR